MTTRNKFSPEVRERAVRMVGEHRTDYGSEWAAMTLIAAQAGNDRDRLRLLEREVKELRPANEILCKASAYFAQAERAETHGAKANGDVVHRRSSRGTGYRADVPRTASCPFLLARTCGPSCRSAAALGSCPAR